MNCYPSCQVKLPDNPIKRTIGFASCRVAVCQHLTRRTRMDDIKSLLEALRQTPKILSEFVKTIPEDKIDLRRGPGFRAFAEHISHLAQVQPMLLKRVERFMNEDHPEFVPYLPDNANEEPDVPKWSLTWS
jgi:hypothetical protein